MGKGDFLLNIAIIDDNNTEQLHIERLISNWGSFINTDTHCDIYSSADQFLSSLSNNIYDIVFTDIYMDNTNGIEMANVFRQSFPTTPIIFITTSCEHYADAFGVHAFDYLQKPVTQDMIDKAMNDLNFFKKNTEDTAHILLPINRKAIPVLYSNIKYINSDSNYLIIHANEILRCRMPFKKLETMLDDDRFLSVNRGILINLDYVLSMDERTCCMTDGTVLPINTKRYKVINQAYITRQFARRTKCLTHRNNGGVQ